MGVVVDVTAVTVVVVMVDEGGIALEGRRLL